MNAFATINLIHLFDFYLAATFALSVWRRWELYRTSVSLVWALPGRWPNLLGLVKGHHTVLLSWPTILPALLAFVVLVFHMTACRLIWPQATLSIPELASYWGWLPFVLLAAAAMLTMDAYTLLVVGKVDREHLEKHFDRAEYWLTDWKAKLITTVTFGTVNVKEIVSGEVKKSLETATELLNRSLWWMTMQTGLRVLFGLSLWATWAVHRHMPGT
jgi:hypothetical protein